MMKLVKKPYRIVRKRIASGRFANSPRNLVIKGPKSIAGANRMTIGDHVFIGQNSRLRAVTRTGPLTRNPDGTHVEQVFDPKVVIGNRVSATAGLHLCCHDSITIEDDVLIAANVFISDALHAIGRIDVPFKYQGFSRIAPIRIKRGSWIGQNVVVMPGVTIGEMSIIGANSVVTRDVPDRCIAVGAPARVIKCWSERAGGWVSAGSGNGVREESESVAMRNAETDV